jgi:transcriptional regulator with XRE-family HTH domain
MRKSAARIAASDDFVFSTELGKVVRHLRRQLGLSQTAVVERSDGVLNQNWLSKVETGEYRTIGAEKLQVLADALDVPVRVLQEAQDRSVQLVDEQMARQWAVGNNPTQDLMIVAQKLETSDVRVLVRVARAMLYGRELRDHYGTDAEEVHSNGARVGAAAG